MEGGLYTLTTLPRGSAVPPATTRTRDEGLLLLSPSLTGGRPTSLVGGRGQTRKTKG